MTDSKIKHKPGRHPNSIANLNYHKVRKTDYGEAKKRRAFSMTNEGWEKIVALAHQLGCSSPSDLCEKIARGQIKLQTSP